MFEIADYIGKLQERLPQLGLGPRDIDLTRFLSLLSAPFLPMLDNLPRVQIEV